MKNFCRDAFYTGWSAHHKSPRDKSSSFSFPSAELSSPSSQNGLRHNCPQQPSHPPVGFEGTLNILCFFSPYSASLLSSPQNHKTMRGRGAVEFKLDRKQSLKVRTWSNNQKIRRHNSIKQICLWVYFYQATGADLALQQRASHLISEMSKWQGAAQRATAGDRDRYANGNLHTAHQTRMQGCKSWTIGGPLSFRVCPDVKLSTGGAKCNTQHKTSESGSLNLSACVCVKVMVSVSTYLLIIACLHSTEPIL